MAGFNDAALVQKIAAPAVTLLIAFLGYYSQFLFHHAKLDPGPPSVTETIVFNVLLLALWYTYYMAITVNPGRYIFPETVIEAEGRWCNKCNLPKPLRAHHCRHCRRCIPKMDHHCPWTRNCVSMTTFPHFLRFLFYSNISLWTLGYLLWQRCYDLWSARNLPAYLGPSLPALISLSFISLICFFTTLALGIMLVSTVKNWMFNITMIEGWELDRHETIAERGGRDWWDITGPDGESIRFEKVEFPYDIGIFSNMSQAMGTGIFPLWFWPFAGNPEIAKKSKGTGWTWEENGFNRTEAMWPPLDPEKIRRDARQWPASRRNFEAELREVDADISNEEQKRRFKERQRHDARRKQSSLMAELEEMDVYDDYNDNSDDLDDYDNDMEARFGEGHRWDDTEGGRLEDFGVDDDVEDSTVEFAKDENVPLSELVRRRKTPGLGPDA